MEINILSRDMAKRRLKDFRSREETKEYSELMIGILDSEPYQNSPTNIPITDEKEVGRITYLYYMFDDLDFHNLRDETRGYKWIDDKTATRMLEKFIEYKDRINTLSIHCREGISRSSAVGWGLNNIFSLGCEDDLNFWWLRPNDYVYYKLIENAAEQDIGKGKEILEGLEDSI